MKHSFKGILFVRIFLLLLFLAFIAWVSAKLDWPLIVRQLGAASLPAEAAMAAAWLTALFIRPLRLLRLLRALAPDIKQHYWHVWSADIVAMAVNSIMPMRAGDMMMAFILRQGPGIPTASVFSAVLIDRFFDFVTVVVIFVAALSVAPTVAPWASDVTITLLVALAVLIGGLGVAIRLRRFWGALFDRLLVSIAPRRSERGRILLRDLFDGLALMDKLHVVVPVVLLSIALWSATITSYWFGMSAIWPSVSFEAAAFAAAAIALSFVVPLTPGGIGVFHAAAVLALSLFGVPAEAALAFAIIAHVFQLSSVLVLATIALICQGISIRSLANLRGTDV